MTYDALVERNVAVGRSELFAVMTDFGAVGKLVPEAVSACDCIGEGVGALRTIELAGGGHVVERMEIAHDESVFAYSMLENTALPLDHYFAVVTLTDIPSGGTQVAWASNWTPHADASEDEIAKGLHGLYNTLIDAMVAAAAAAA